MADPRDAIREDDRLQADPEMHEGQAGWGRILMTLVGATFIVGLVIFGLAQHRAENESAVSQSSSTAVPPATAHNTAPTIDNPADQPAAAARGPSSKEQAQQQGANTGQAPGASGNTGQAPAAGDAPAQSR